MLVCLIPLAKRPSPASCRLLEKPLPSPCPRLPRVPEDQAEAVEVAGLRRRGYPSAAFATEATWCSTHQPEHSAVVLQQHHGACLAAGGVCRSFAAHAPQTHQDSAARRPDDARLRLRRARQCLNQLQNATHLGSMAWDSLIDLRTGDHCRLRRRRPRRGVAREEPGPEDVRLVGRRRRRHLCQQRLRAEQGVVSCFGTCPRNE